MSDWPEDLEQDRAKQREGDGYKNSDPSKE